MDAFNDDTFNKAAAHLPNIMKNMTESDLLYLYARYKQANVGKCNTSKPSFWDFEGKKKWIAWNELASMDSLTAKTEYINKIKELDPEFSDETQIENGNTKKSIGFGITVSRPMYNEEIEDNLDHNLSETEFNLLTFCKQGELEKLKENILNKDLTKIKDNEQRNLLHWACDRGYFDIVEYLLMNCKININDQDNDGLTPLHYAVQCEHNNIVSFLIKHNADPNIKDNDGDTPISCASTVIKSILQT